MPAGYAVYSAHLDKNTCEICERDDGTIGPPGGLPELPCPNPRCLGGDNCRCMWVPVVTDELVIDVPTEGIITPLPRAGRGQFKH